MSSHPPGPTGCPGLFRAREPGGRGYGHAQMRELYVQKQE
jgi:hypothetical protein